MRGFYFETALFLYYRMDMRVRSLAVSLLLLSGFACAQNSTVAQELLGTWGASLNNGDEGVFFRIEIEEHNGNLQAAVLNGNERMPFSSAKVENGELTLRFEQY